MEKERNKRIIFSFLMVILVLGVSLGFASWFKMLSISSSRANVISPDDPFPTGLILSSSDGTVNENVWSGLTAEFYDDGKGNAAYSYTYTAKIENHTDYIAYLRSISSNNNVITCEQMDAISPTYLSAEDICEYVSVDLTVDEASTTLTSSVPMDYEASSNRYNIAAQRNGVYSSHNIRLTISLDNSVTIPDGDVKILIPDIIFSYTSLKN